MKKGIPADEIIRLSEKEGVDTVVIGSHGRDGAKKFFRKIVVICFKVIVFLFFYLMTFQGVISSEDTDVSYSTYLGGSTDSIAYGLAVDKAGNAYITGYTRSFDFPVTDGAYQKSNARFVDTFFARISDTGSLSYATYLGGNGFDNGRDIAIDAKGNIYIITGTVTSKDFPIKNPLQSAHGGGCDAFITKINSDYPYAFVAKINQRRTR